MQSAIIQKKMSTKLQDPENFTISCTIRTQFVDKALCDLSARINLMPLSVYVKPGLKEIKPMNITLQLADKSISYPKGEIEDVLMKVDSFMFLIDFVIFDCEEDQKVSLISRRSFLATSQTLIDVRNGKLTIMCSILSSF